MVPSARLNCGIFISMGAKDHLPNAISYDAGVDVGVGKPLRRFHRAILAPFGEVGSSNPSQFRRTRKSGHRIFLFSSHQQPTELRGRRQIQAVWQPDPQRRSPIPLERRWLAFEARAIDGLSYTF